MKWRTVIEREYLAQVRRKSFIVSTILVPVLMAVFFVLPVIIASVTPERQYRLDVIDGTGQLAAAFVATLDDTLGDGTRRFDATARVAPDPESFGRLREQGVQQVRDGMIDILLVLPPDAIESGRAEYVTRDVRSFNILEMLESHLDDVVVRRRLEREGIDYARVSELTKGVTLEVNQITAGGEVKKRDVMSEWGMVFVFVMILYMSLLSWGLAISRGIIEEKGSRVVEVLLSSVRPVDLMIGKVVGIGAAGFTQLAIWAAAGLVLTAYGATAAAGLLANLQLEPSVFGWMLVFYVLGFLLYAAVFSVVGSICSTEQDAQQLQGLITLPMILPIMFLMLIIQNPNGVFSVVLSIVPVTSPMVMLARIVLFDPPAWQVGASLAVLAASIYGAIAFSARVFRVGILMTGKRPGLGEVVRWYRRAA